MTKIQKIPISIWQLFHNAVQNFGFFGKNSAFSFYHLQEKAHEQSHYLVQMASNRISLSNFM